MSKFVTLHGFGGGNSGTDLNFEIVGGTTQPTNPTENMIWVNTDVEITNYYFTLEQPENIVNGDMWIPVDSKSSIKFNILKNGSMQIFPLYVKQMISGVLMDKEAKIYQNNTWVNLLSDMYLFKSGNEYTEITGGWTTSGFRFRGAGFGSLSNNGNVLSMRGVAGSTYGGCITTNKIDITNYNNIKFKGSISIADGYDNIAFISQSKVISSREATTSYHLFGTISGSYERNLDISAISGEYFIGVVHNGSLSEVILEV